MSVRLGILTLLADEPRHGYELKTEFERRTAGVWPLNIGQVYTTLDRLERDGLVEPVASNGERNQRSFAITDAGRVELRTWVSTSDADAAPPRDALILKVLLAAATGPSDAIDVIAIQRSALFSTLQTRRQEQLAAAAGPSLAAELMHDVLAVRIEADLRWLDHCEARLRDAR